MGERNTIEMLAITALAHLNAAVIYIMDASQQCGQSLEQQAELFRNIRPLFSNKPLRIMLNKCDIINPDDFSEEDKKIIQDLSKPTDFDDKIVPITHTSTVTELGLIELRNEICEELLAKRIDDK